MGRVGLMLLMLASCAPPFEPLYEGEPDCGRPDAVHAIERALCDGTVQAACSCDDRNTLHCVDGSWQWAHAICYGGLGVSQ